MASFSQKGTQLLDDTEDQYERSGSSDDYASDRDPASASGTDNEDEVAGVGSEAMTEKPAKEKRHRKPRRPNMLKNDAQVITRVDNKAIPISPAKAANGYSIATGVIVHDHVPISCPDLRAPKHENLREYIIHTLYN